MGRPQPPKSAVLLHGRRIGSLAELPADRALFAFDDAYVADAARPTLSLAYLSESGGLCAAVREPRRKLPPFFANLLPEGALRAHMAAAVGEPADGLAWLLRFGRDLPGAVTVQAEAPGPERAARARPLQPRRSAPAGARRGWRFSLAGSTLKFSARMTRGGRLKIAPDGAGGTWIVKLPHPLRPALAENECAMLALARRAGIDAPEARLLDPADVAGCPPQEHGGKALAVRRYDRDADGRPVHAEDFAQVFGLQPGDQRRAQLGYAEVAWVLSEGPGAAGVRELLRRLTFAVVTGNGDLHLKNLALRYPDRRDPALAPACDLAATAPYDPGAELALPFGGERGLDGIRRGQLRRFARRARLPAEELAAERLAALAARTAARIADAWRELDEKDLLPRLLRAALDRRIGDVARRVCA